MKSRTRLSYVDLRIVAWFWGEGLNIATCLIVKNAFFLSGGYASSHSQSNGSARNNLPCIHILGIYLLQSTLCITDNELKLPLKTM